MDKILFDVKICELTTNVSLRLSLGSRKVKSRETLSHD